MDYRPLIAGALAVLVVGFAGLLHRDTASRLEALEHGLASSVGDRPPAGPGTPAGPGAEELAKSVERLRLQVARLESAGAGAVPPRESAAPIPDTAESVNNLFGRIAAIEQRLDALEPQLRVALERGAAPPGRARPASDARTPGESRKASRERAAAAQEERLVQLAGRHAGEARDAGWAHTVETSLRSALQARPSLAEHARLQEIDCRSSLCRVWWTFDEGLSSPQYFELENDMAVALGEAGLRQGTVAGSALEPGGSEGYFFRELDNAADPRRRGDPQSKR